MLSIIADALGIATRTNGHILTADYYSKGNFNYHEQEAQRQKRAMRNLEVARTRAHW
jgi:hypothetical protein